LQLLEIILALEWPPIVVQLIQYNLIGSYYLNVIAPDQWCRGILIQIDYMKKVLKTIVLVVYIILFYIIYTEGNSFSSYVLLSIFTTLSLSIFNYFDPQDFNEENTYFNNEIIKISWFGVKKNLGNYFIDFLLLFPILFYCFNYKLDNDSLIKIVFAIFLVANLSVIFIALNTVILKYYRKYYYIHIIFLGVNLQLFLIGFDINYTNVMLYGVFYIAVSYILILFISYKTNYMSSNKA
jgi:hypothetical protein